MSENQTEEVRNIENYFPFEIMVKTAPMLFFWDLQKKTLKAEIKSYLLNDFNAGEFLPSGEPSAYALLSDKVSLIGSLYQGIVEAESFASTFGVLEEKARAIAKFTEADTLRALIINSEETFVEIRGERIINGQADFDGDPSKFYGTTQNKFETLKHQNPDLLQLYYGLVLTIFATIDSPRKRFYQAILQQLG